MHATIRLSRTGGPSVDSQPQLSPFLYNSVSIRPVVQVHTRAASSARRLKGVHCRAEGRTGPGRQYETEFFRKFFGAPPVPKQDDASGGGGNQPPSSGQNVDEEDEPDEEQLLQARSQARQQAFFNFVSLFIFFGTLAGLSTWEPRFRYLGRIWRVVRVGHQAQVYTELASEGFTWALLLTMGWPWNLLIYPVHLTRKELTNARKEHRGPNLQNIRNSIYNPFARRRPSAPSDQGATSAV